MNSQSRYTLRIIAGLYLFYLSYTLLKNWDPNSKIKIVAILSIVVFTAAGIILLITSVKNLIKMRKNESDK